jgi:hypothetical protein
MHVCAGDQEKRNAFLPESILHMLNRRIDLRTSIVIQSWQDMGRARKDRHTARDRSPHHIQRNTDVYSPIVDPRQNVAMQINRAAHITSLSLTVLPRRHPHPHPVISHLAD